MTQGNGGISEMVRTVLVVCHKPEALNQINNLLHNGHVQVKMSRQKGLLRDTQQLPVPLRGIKRQWRGGTDREAKCFFFVCLTFLFVFRFCVCVFGVFVCLF